MVSASKTYFPTRYASLPLTLFSRTRAPPLPPRLASPLVSLSPAASNLLCLPASANSRHKAIPRVRSSCSARLSTRSFRLPAYRDTCFRPRARGKAARGKGGQQSLLDSFSRRFLPSICGKRKGRNEFIERTRRLYFFF